jgi:hypothetical protein
MRTFDRAPLTVNHPPANVDAATWKYVAVGEAHDPTCAGDVMCAELVVRDKAAIKAIQDGKAELSNGYSFELDMTAGTAPNGETYDGIQRNITGNHVAIVDFARGGPALRIADQDTNRKGKIMRTIIVDGVSIKLEDDTAASLVEKVVGDSSKAAKTAADAATAAIARAETAEAALAAEKAASAKLVTDHATALKAATDQIPTDAEIEALAAERATVVADAAVLAPELKAEGKKVDAIRTEALAVIVAGDEDCKAIASAITGDAAEPTAAVTKQAFDAAVVAIKRRGNIDGTQFQATTGNDSAALADAAAGRSHGSLVTGKLTGIDLMRARMKGTVKDAA